jgi:hypothetical protein
LRFGVCGEEDLKSAIEEKAFDVVGADAAAGGVGGFEDDDVEAGFLQGESAVEAG